MMIERHYTQDRAIPTILTSTKGRYEFFKDDKWNGFTVMQNPNAHEGMAYVYMNGQLIFTVHNLFSAPADHNKAILEQAIKESRIRLCPLELVNE